VLIEERWARFAKSVTTDGRTLREALQLFLETTARDGEVFVIIRRGEEFGKYMMSLQFYEAEYVDYNHNGLTNNGNEVKNGIEYDQYGRPTAYYFWKYHPATNNVAYRNERIRVDAKDVIHGYDRERVNQGRGFPWLAAGLIQLAHLKEYEKSELVASRIASAKMGFYTRPKGENEIGDEEDPVDKNAMLQEVEPGVFDVLPEGYSLQTFDPQNPTGNFGMFVKVILRGIAASVGVAYHTLANDLESTSYSSLRQGSIDERETFKHQQQWLIEHFLTKVFEEWLKILIAFRVDGMRLPLDSYDKFNAPLWRPRTWQWIDPAKETAAIKMQLNENIRSRTDVARQMGVDYVDVLAEIAEEQRLAKEMGVVIEPTAEVSKQEILQGTPDAEQQVEDEQEEQDQAQNTGRNRKKR
jgi:lambda family phage portal protein